MNSLLTVPWLAGNCHMLYDRSVYADCDIYTKVLLAYMETRTNTKIEGRSIILSLHMYRKKILLKQYFGVIEKKKCRLTIPEKS